MVMIGLFLLSFSLGAVVMFVILPKAGVSFSAHEISSNDSLEELVSIGEEAPPSPISDSNQAITNLDSSLLDTVEDPIEEEEIVEELFAEIKEIPETLRNELFVKQAEEAQETTKRQIIGPTKGRKDPTDPEEEDVIFVEKEPKPLNLTRVRNLIGYPEEAKKAGIEGVVILRVLLTTDGSYKRHIVVNQGHPILLEACEQYISEVQFTPAIQNRKPVKFWINVPFWFPEN